MSPPLISLPGEEERAKTVMRLAASEMMRAVIERGAELDTNRWQARLIEALSAWVIPARMRVQVSAKAVGGARSVYSTAAWLAFTYRDDHGRGEVVIFPGKLIELYTNFEMPSVLPWHQAMSTTEFARRMRQKRGERG